MTGTSGSKSGGTDREPQPIRPFNVRRNDKGQLLSGSNLNPDGPRAGFKHARTRMNEALAEQARLTGLTFEQVLCERAWRDPRYAMELARILYPRPAADAMPALPPPTGAPPVDVDLGALPADARNALRAFLVAARPNGGAAGLSQPPAITVDAKAVAPTKKPRTGRKRAKQTGNGRKVGRRKKKT